MDGEISISDQSLKNKIATGGLNVLVVDDDIICLSIVAGILKTLKYEVVTVKNAKDALITLQQRTNFFHLVVTDVHMPGMDGFEFQKKVREKFNLPVVFMSADDKEGSILRGLEAGAAFYIVKPVNYDDLRNLWQYAVSSRKVKHADNGKIRSSRGASLVQKTSIDVGVESVAPLKDQKKNKRDTKNKAAVNEDNGKEKTEIVAPKKTKVLWTTALHNRFLEAIRKIGLERAVPKRILETMDMPGLSRENVASHLQKYRIFLKRVTEAGNSNGSSSGKNSLERTLRSSFATGHPSLMIRALQPGFSQFMDHDQLGSSLQPGFLEPSHRSTAVFPDQQASSNDHFISQLEYGQFNARNNQDYFQQKSTPGGADLSSNQFRGPSQFLSSDCMSNTNNFTVFGEPVTKDSSLKQNIAGSGQMGFADRGEISNAFSGSYGLMNGNNGNMTLTLSGNLNNSDYCPQEVFSSSGFSNVIQQEYNPMLGNVLLPKLSENIGLDEVYLNRPNKPFYNEQLVGEEAQNHGYTIHPNSIQQNPPENLHSFNQREWDGSINSNGMNEFDKYFLSLDRPHPNQQQGRGLFPDGNTYNGYPKLNTAQNQSATDDFIGFIFGSGTY